MKAQHNLAPMQVITVNRIVKVLTAAVLRVQLRVFLRMRVTLNANVGPKSPDSKKNTSDVRQKFRLKLFSNILKRNIDTEKEAFARWKTICLILVKPMGLKRNNRNSGDGTFDDRKKETSVRLLMNFVNKKVRVNKRNALNKLANLDDIPAAKDNITHRMKKLDYQTDD